MADYNTAFSSLAIILLVPNAIVLILQLIKFITYTSQQNNRSRIALTNVIRNAIAIAVFFLIIINPDLSLFVLIIECAVTCLNLWGSMYKKPFDKVRMALGSIFLGKPRSFPMPQSLYKPATAQHSTETVSDVLGRIDSMNGIEFERYCSKLLAENGFINVELTPGSGDQGADILATYNNCKYVIQCKRYASPLGNTPVQEVYAAKALYGGDKTAVLTNSTFTAGAEKLALSTDTLLWDREVLKKLISGTFSKYW